MGNRKMPMRNNPQGENDYKCVRGILNAGIRAVEGEGNERRFELSFSSEEPYGRWYGTEILDHSDGCVDLGRLQTIGVLLFNHKTDRVIGRIEKAWVEDGRGKAIVVFDDDDDSEVIRKKVESGTLKGVSVGYAVSVWEEVAANKQSKDGRFSGPCFIAVRWEPLEISIVSVPADPTVGVGRAIDAGVEEDYRIPIWERTIQLNQNRRRGGKG